MVLASKALSVLFKTDAVREELHRERQEQEEKHIVGNFRRRRLSFDAADGECVLFLTLFD